ncbi:ABC/ECF transporter, transmembrane component [Acididesulfobacillus acetoxydans]|uniref:ABC/ECF transporter, transmembrane component n=1 Tax=Acididesulfobacillus acetoxydans TaxID=1561005 RepID=A0A8S0XAU2_9FIRM|nr:energy-coupling factor transporter transmembrane component T [Acididesulfobacillus acetoxydans]CAA7600396.1 ABC/ECF transporter, transmembrane component [Acididesulfobacillus acetoxydans]CEJ07918.1 Cobalt transport protein [Acididesulfobacillus acetoxydans]
MLSFFTQTILGRTIVGYLLMFVVPLILPVVFVKLVGFRGLRHLFSYEPKETPIHRLDPRFKIIYPVVIGILSIVLNWNYVLALLGLTLIPWILLRPTRNRVRVTLTMAFTPVIGMIWSQGLFYVIPGESHLLFAFPWTISWFGTPGLSGAGLLHGLHEAGRMLVPASASLIVLLSTKPSEIIWAFAKFNLPPVAGFAFTVALRFVPQMFERVALLQKAMEVRGYSLKAPAWRQPAEWPGYLGRVLASIPALSAALLVGSLRTTSVMAMVADARAFGSHRARTTLREHQMNSSDRFAWGALALLTVTVAGLVGLHIGGRA